MRLSPLSLLCLCALLLLTLPTMVLGGRDFYKILGVDRRASEKAIKKAYRQMSKLHHPDRNPEGGEEAQKRFVDIAAAYETLSDKEKRRVYDQGGEEALKQQGQGGGGGGDPFDLFRGFGFGGFGQQHGHGHGQAEERRGEDVRLDLVVTLEDLYKGRVYEVQLKQQHLCSQCRGTGAQKESDVVKCHTCQGRGVQIKVVSLGPGFMQQVQQQCETCHGKGKIIKSKCSKCGGAKVMKGTKTLDVMVEIGMRDGAQIEFEHAADEHPDHAAGHVIFTVQTLPHARFMRQGDDLHVVERISLLESLVGFTHTLTHLDGHTVPLSSSGSKVTAHGEVQRIVKEGMPKHTRASERGDLYVTYEVVFPKKLTTEQKEMFLRVLPK